MWDVLALSYGVLKVRIPLHPPRGNLRQVLRSQLPVALRD